VCGLEKDQVAKIKLGNVTVGREVEFFGVWYDVGSLLLAAEGWRVVGGVAALPLDKAPGKGSS
jgi:hypothetical protein